MKKSKTVNSRYHKDRIKEYLNQGALVLDVRSKGEWERGHITDALHIELNEIPANIDKIKAFKKPIIAVCVSGVRSGQVSELLKRHDVDVFNGASWEVVAELVNANK